MKDNTWIPIAAIMIPVIATFAAAYWQIKAMRAIAKPAEIPPKKTSNVSGKITNFIKRYKSDIVGIGFPIAGFIVGTIPFWSSPNWYFFVLLINAMSVTAYLAFYAAKKYLTYMILERERVISDLAEAYTNLKDALAEKLRLSDMQLKLLKHSIERVERLSKTDTPKSAKKRKSSSADSQNPQE